jgi:hypothetical protein
MKCRGRVFTGHPSDKEDHVVRVFVFVIAAFASHAVFAQSRATGADLAGVVLDESRAVLQSIPVVVTHLDTDVERSVVSGQNGEFHVPALSPGFYRVRVEAQGFAPHVIDRIELVLGSSVSLEIVMRVAAVAEGVVVAAESPAVELQRAVVATTVSQHQIENLPINGRNFISFSLITPGVITDRMPVQGATATSGLSFGGQRARSNNITVDGLDNNDSVVGSVRATFSQEAVQEFQVLMQGYSAEFGKASGGIVNIVTRSGGNQPSGSAFVYFRDDALNAKEYFERFNPGGQALDQPKAPFSQKQFGGVFGGPIVRSRTFFFGSFERLDVDASNFVTIDDTTIVNVLGQPAGTAAGILRRAGFPIQVGHVPYVNTLNQGVFKVDHNIANGHRLTLRYNFASGYNENVESWGGQVARSRGGALDNRDHMVAGSLTSILSPATVNELRFQVARRDQSLLPLDPTCIDRCDQLEEGGPTIEVSGVAMAGRVRTAPQIRNNVRYQAVETLSRQTRSHLFKAGVDFNTVDHFVSTLPIHFGGRYIFTALPAIPGLLPAPISAIEAFALGLPAAYVQGYGNPETAYVVSDLSAFAQDQWRIGQRLTVQAGLRYQTQFWPKRQYAAPVLGEYPIHSDRNDLAPRVGFNWDPSGTGTLSIHSAYGIYYDNVITALPGIVDVANGTSGVRNLVVRFPQSVSAWSTPGHRLPEPAGPYVSLITAIDPNLRTSYSHQFSIGIDRNLGRSVTVAAGFLLSEGFNQVGTLDYNPLVPSLGAGRRPEDVGGVPGTSTTVLQFTSYGRSSYRGLSVGARKRLANGTQFMASYVLSKAEDMTADFQSAFVPQDQGRGRDPANPRGLPVAFDADLDIGPSLQDQRHRFVFSGTYVAPHGLHLSGIVTLASGVPFNIIAGSDLNGDGDAGTFPVDRARVNPADASTSVGRNTGRLPAESTVDVRFSRQWRLSRTTIEPMIEVFNLLNHTNFTAVNNVFGTSAFPSSPLPGYGQYQQAAAARQAQVALRVLF